MLFRSLGGSAGGLLMGAISNMAPEDYRVILSQVPFVDVVTTMLDPSIPLTTNEYDEWGNPEASADSYAYMLSYSPYDNLKAQAYPAMFVGTGLWDSQVQYWEPAKYVARLRDVNTGSYPSSSAPIWKRGTEVNPAASAAIAKRRKCTPSCWISWGSQNKEAGQCPAFFCVCSEDRWGKHY